MQYYHDLEHDGLLKGFKDLDDPSNFKSLDDKVRHSRTKNFVIDFSDDEAYCGFDIDAEGMRRLLDNQRPAQLNTRWINIWLPHEQRDVITELAKHFEFSPRLLGLMLSAPIKSVTRSQAIKRSVLDRLRGRRAETRAYSMADMPLPNVEEGYVLGDLRPSQTADIDLSKAMNQYNLANEVWHWSSVDWGRRFLCLGYNSLYPVPYCHHSRNDTDQGADVFEGDEDWRDHDLPEGKRVWSWLLLCEDKTVITVSEDPFPYHAGQLDVSERKSLLTIRRNLINVFRNCSKGHDSTSDPPVMKLPLRYRVGESDEETAHRPSDTPGLLFYCLFDDWFGSYSVVFRREHRYGHELEQLRLAMMRRAELAHIDRLHHIGRQLAVLRRMYQSYELVIDRVLAKQEATLASLKNSRVIAPGGGGGGGCDGGAGAIGHRAPSLDSSVQHVVAESQSLLGVGLSSASRMRFERLRHRIRLYALSEIEECLAQKDNLVMMNFNLIAIVESLSVERLTRVTLLLAKVTILFMPVSLMSAYFSCQLVDVTLTNGQYWMWFGVVLTVSLVGLVAFSVISGTLEGSMIYKPLGRRLVEWYEGRKKRGKGRRL